MRRAGAPLVVALLTVLALPAATAHTVEDPLSVETQLLQDEGRDEFYWYDGYDLWTLFVREAHLAEDGTTGLVFRFTLYGGFGPANLSESLHVDVGLDGPDGERTLRLSTLDDETWSGDMVVLEQNVTEEAPPWTGVTTTIQAFASYETIGAGPGESISAFRMASWADDDLRDAAPGGFYVPNSQGLAEIPSDNSDAGEAAYLDSRRLVDNLTLEGPVGYVEPSISVDGWNATIEVTSPFETQGQHVVLQPRATPGWDVTVRGRAALLLDPEASGTFELEARPGADATQPLPVDLWTDIGGLETLYLGADEGGLVPAGTPDAALDVPEPAPASTPGPGLVLAVLAAAAAAAWRRSNR